MAKALPSSRFSAKFGTDHFDYGNDEENYEGQPEQDWLKLGKELLDAT
ncbi:MAG TPA: hypothetical protein VMF91_02610 [Bryobacteraceae bacterium]|nr:hypothetical protein [Bryobacteraceae bacterium]